MTLPQNVKDAVRQLDESIGNWGIRRDAWQTIRAHLMSQEAEIARLNRLWESMTNLAVKKDSQIKIAESRLAAANALLRECHCYFEARGVDSRTIGESLSLNEKIQSHLQGAGDE